MAALLLSCELSSPLDFGQNQYTFFAAIVNGTLPKSPNRFVPLTAGWQNLNPSIGNCADIDMLPSYDVSMSINSRRTPV
jgi:hypothetical protein